LNGYKTAALSTDGRVILVPGAGHGIHLDRPQIVIETIEEVIARARTR
jgi:pimeloyl-ACP methyl ester carboxylesterase